MKLSIELADEQNNVITAYDRDRICVNKTDFSGSLIVCPDHIVDDWSLEDISRLEASHLKIFTGLKVEIVLFGTGTRQIFPNPRLLASLQMQDIGVEIMTTSAACRTYNILMAEGRRVAAALLPIK